MPPPHPLRLFNGTAIRVIVIFHRRSNRRRLTTIGVDRVWARYKKKPLPGCFFFTGFRLRLLALGSVSFFCCGHHLQLRSSCPFVKRSVPVSFGCHGDRVRPDAAVACRAIVLFHFFLCVIFFFRLTFIFKSITNRLRLLEFFFPQFVVFVCVYFL